MRILDFYNAYEYGIILSIKIYQNQILKRKICCGNEWLCKKILIFQNHFKPPKNNLKLALKSYLSFLVLSYKVKAAMSFKRTTNASFEISIANNSKSTNLIKYIGENNFHLSYTYGQNFESQSLTVFLQLIKGWYMYLCINLMIIISMVSKTTLIDVEMWLRATV